MPKNNTTEDVQADPFITTLQNKLMDQSNVITSSTTGIEKTISDAIKGVKTSNNATNRRIDSQYTRERGYLDDEVKSNVTDFAESRGGFGTQMAAFRTLVKTADKNYNDLQMRKEELQLEGDAASASRISELQLKGLEFKQKAQQDVFSNLLSMSNFGLALREDKRSQDRLDFEAKKQSWAEKSQMVEMGAEFGVAVGDGDTLETVAAKIAPLVTADRNLKIRQTVADIRNSEAQAAKALRGDPPKAQLDPMTSALLAEQWSKGNKDFFFKLSPEQQNQVAPYVTKIKETQTGELNQLADKMSQEEFMTYVNDPNSPVYDDNAINDVYFKKYLNAEKAPAPPSYIDKISGMFSDDGLGNDFSDKIARFAHPQDFYQDNKGNWKKFTK